MEEILPQIDSKRLTIDEFMEMDDSKKQQYIDKTKKYISEKSIAEFLCDFFLINM